MAKGRKRKAINTLVEHISDFSDMEYDNEESADDVISMQVQSKNDRKCEDETDKMWMYKNEEDELTDEDEITDEDLWGEQKESQKEKEENVSTSVESKTTGINDSERYMTAAAWFHEINERGFMTDLEKRYVSLMLIEMSKFYFDNLKEMCPSVKCKEAIIKIYRDIREADICSG